MGQRRAPVNGNDDRLKRVAFSRQGLRALAAALTFLIGAGLTAAADLDKERLQLIRPKIQAFVDQGEIAGAVTLVGRSSGVASLEAVGFQDLEKKIPMRTDSLFRIASMTKPVTAIGIMILVDEKKLSVDDPVAKHLPEFRDMKLKAGDGAKAGKLVSPSRPILVRHLLTHTSGMHGGLPRAPADLYNTRDHTLAEAVPMFAKEPLESEPGTKWSYCNVGMDTLGRIIEVVSGQRYEDFLKQRVFDRLGMVDTCFYPSDEQRARIAATYDKKEGRLVRTPRDIIGLPPGAKYPIPAGGLYSTAGDLAKLYRMMLNRGELDGRRILSPESVATMTRVQTGELTSGFVNGMGFGFGWGVVRKPVEVTEMLSPGTFGHGGAFGTQGWIDPHKDLFVVLMIQRVGLPNADASPMRRQLQAIAVSALAAARQKGNKPNSGRRDAATEGGPVARIGRIPFSDLAELAPGWRGEVVARVDQSYNGWGVAIGDADNDGQNEVLTTGCPDSRLYLFKKSSGAWQMRLLAENLAHRRPGMGLALRVLDLNGDGRNELILGTGQEMAEPAYFYVLETDGRRITRQISARPSLVDSAFTHNFGCHDLDGDGLVEVIAAYCSSGEIVRFDVDKGLAQAAARTIHKHPGSGEDSWIADVDNDGRVEYVTVSGYREDQATVQIFDFDARGELVKPAQVVIDGFDGQKCFVAAVAVGDVDNDGRRELVVGWNRKHKVNKGTILGYRIEGRQARPLYTFAHEDPAMDYGYFEKMMCVADADNDGKNELVVTTRGEPAFTGHADGAGLAHVFMFSIGPGREVRRTLLVNFREGQAHSCWPAVGDADNDGKNEVVIATGRGIRMEPGASHVVLVKKQ